MLYAALHFSQRPQDTLYSEYKTWPASRESEKPRAYAVDLVYQVEKTKRFVFSLKDVKVTHLPTLGVAPGANWEEQNKASQGLKQWSVESLRAMKYEVPKPLLQLMSPQKREEAEKLTTVLQVEESCLNELSTKYLPQLRTDSAKEGKVVAFALTRVGIHRMLASEPML